MVVWWVRYPPGSRPVEGIFPLGLTFGSDSTPYQLFEMRAFTKVYSYPNRGESCCVKLYSNGNWGESCHVKLCSNGNWGESCCVKLFSDRNRGGVSHVVETGVSHQTVYISTETGVSHVASNCIATETGVSHVTSNCIATETGVSHVALKCIATETRVSHVSYWIQRKPGLAMSHQTGFKGIRGESCRVKLDSTETRVSHVASNCIAMETRLCNKASNSIAITAVLPVLEDFQFNI